MALWVSDSTNLVPDTTLQPSSASTLQNKLIYTQICLNFSVSHDRATRVQSSADGMFCTVFEVWPWSKSKAPGKSCDTRELLTHVTWATLPWVTVSGLK